MTAIDLDACLELIADEDRRALIRQLCHGPNERTATDELVTQLRRQRDRSTRGRSVGRKELATRLSHVHLPKLAAHGVVEYDREAGTVRYQPHERIETLLDRLPEEVPHAHP